MLNKEIEVVTFQNDFVSDLAVDCVQKTSSQAYGIDYPIVRRKIPLFMPSMTVSSDRDHKKSLSDTEAFLTKQIEIYKQQLKQSGKDDIYDIDTDLYGKNTKTIIVLAKESMTVERRKHDFSIKRTVITVAEDLEGRRRAIGKSPTDAITVSLLKENIPSPPNRRYLFGLSINLAVMRVFSG